MSERVSILIRSSARPELADALGCLAAQTYRNLDAVILNVTGRPPPALPPAAAQLAVHFLEPDRQPPRPQAQNADSDPATGECAAFPDGDDRLEPERVAACVAAATA